MKVVPILFTPQSEHNVIIVYPKDEESTRHSKRAHHEEQMEGLGLRKKHKGPYQTSRKHIVEVVPVVSRPCRGNEGSPTRQNEHNCTLEKSIGVEPRGSCQRVNE